MTEYTPIPFKTRWNYETHPIHTDSIYLDKTEILPSDSTTYRIISIAVSNDDYYRYSFTIPAGGFVTPRTDNLPYILRNIPLERIFTFPFSKKSFDIVEGFIFDEIPEKLVVTCGAVSIMFNISERIFLPGDNYLLNMNNIFFQDVSVSFVFSDTSKVVGTPNIKIVLGAMSINLIKENRDEIHTITHNNKKYFFNYYGGVLTLTDEEDTFLFRNKK